MKTPVNGLSCLSVCVSHTLRVFLKEPVAYSPRRVAARDVLSVVRGEMQNVKWRVAAAATGKLFR